MVRVLELGSQNQLLEPSPALRAGALVSEFAEGFLT
jgi:hypothetical protein